MEDEVASVGPVLFRVQQAREATRSNYRRLFRYDVLPPFKNCIRAKKNVSLIKITPNGSSWINEFDDVTASVSASASANNCSQPEKPLATNDRIRLLHSLRRSTNPKALEKQFADREAASAKITGEHSSNATTSVEESTVAFPWLQQLLPYDERFNAAVFVEKLLAAFAAKLESTANDAIAVNVFVNNQHFSTTAILSACAADEPSLMQSPEPTNAETVAVPAKRKSDNEFSVPLYPPKRRMRASGNSVTTQTSAFASSKVFGSGPPAMCVPDSVPLFSGPSPEESLLERMWRATAETTSSLGDESVFASSALESLLKNSSSSSSTQLQNEAALELFCDDTPVLPFVSSLSPVLGTVSSSKITPSPLSSTAWDFHVRILNASEARSVTDTLVLLPPPRSAVLEKHKQRSKHRQKQRAASHARRSAIRLVKRATAFAPASPRRTVVSGVLQAPLDPIVEPVIAIEDSPKPSSPRSVSPIAVPPRSDSPIPIQQPEEVATEPKMIANVNPARSPRHRASSSMFQRFVPRPRPSIKRISFNQNKICAAPLAAPIIEHQDNDDVSDPISRREINIEKVIDSVVKSAVCSSPIKTVPPRKPAVRNPIGTNIWSEPYVSSVGLQQSIAQAQIQNPNRRIVLPAEILIGDSSGEDDDNDPSVASCSSSQYVHSLKEQRSKIPSARGTSTWRFEIPNHATNLQTFSIQKRSKASGITVEPRPATMPKIGMFYSLCPPVRALCANTTPPLTTDKCNGKSLAFGNGQVYHGTPQQYTSPPRQVVNSVVSNHHAPRIIVIPAPRATHDSSCYALPPQLMPQQPVVTKPAHNDTCTKIRYLAVPPPLPSQNKAVFIPISVAPGTSGYQKLVASAPKVLYATEVPTRSTKLRFVRIGDKITTLPTGSSFPVVSMPSNRLNAPPPAGFWPISSTVAATDHVPEDPSSSRTTTAIGHQNNKLFLVSGTGPPNFHCNNG